MNGLLRIDASARRDRSHSRALADHFESRWRTTNPGCRVLTRDLAQTPPTHLTDDMIAAFFPGQTARTTESNQLIQELSEASHLLISTPIYNFGAPSPLKAYLDQIIRSGRTFEFRDGRYTGLLTDKTATIILACGGIADPDNDFLSNWLIRALKFIGIRQIDLFTIDRIAIEPDGVNETQQDLEREIDATFGIFNDDIWHGLFHDNDRRQINHLRQQQADAILASDARRYADLCADDVQLMLPGTGPVQGKTALLELEQSLFRSTRFQSFRKRPIRVEGSHDLAVETGVQTVQSVNPAPNSGVCARRQKYTHVYRRTTDGWRFAVLMSNDNGEQGHG